MNEYTQITLDEWMQWKEDIRRKLSETASNFVYIGYRLKQIRDSGMYDGASDVFEFAMKEYGLGKSTVSRFIAINERYSEGGNSLELKEEYRAFSSSKLAEMLTLSDNDIQMITDRTTIKEIRELKDFVRQEVPREEGEDEERTPLEKCLIDYFRTREEMLNGIMKYLEQEPTAYKKAAEQMNPSGQASHKKGIVFLFLYDWNTGIKYKLLTQPEPVSMTWPELLNDVYRIFGACESPEKAWEDFYGGEATVNAVKIAHVASGFLDTASTLTDQGLKSSVATSQQEQEKGGETTAAAGDQEPQEEPQLPGQMTVEDYPELLPESNGADGGSPTAGAGEESDTAAAGVKEMEETAGSSYMEENDGESDECGNHTGVSDGAGDLRDDVESGSDQMVEDTVSEHHEGAGASAGGGCEADTGITENDESLTDQGIADAMQTSEDALAAGIDPEIYKDLLWSNAARDAEDLNNFFLGNTVRYMEETIQETVLREGYEMAINVAAALERMINAKYYA